MDFKQLETFVNVIKFGSFSKAADATFLTQPTISTHVKTLEEELGVVLINRKKFDATPTEEGARLYRYALDMLNTREEALMECKQMTKEIRGVIAIQSSSIPGEYILPKLITEYHRKFPDVKFYVEQSDSGLVEENIQMNKGDLGFIGTSPMKKIEGVEILSDQMVLICPKTERFIKLRKERRSLSLEEIVKEHFIWREEGSATRKEFESEFRDRGFNPSRLKIAAFLNSMEGVKQAVAAGMGVSVISKLAVRQDINGGSCRVIAFDIEELDMRRPIYMVWNRNTNLAPIARSFQKYIFDLKKEGYFEKLLDE